MKTKTALFIIGGGMAVTALYLYIRRQVKLALEWDYSIKRISVRNVTNDKADLEGVISFKNTSNFQAKVLGYDLSFYYAGNLLGNTKSDNQFIVYPDTMFEVPIEGELLISGVKSSLLPLVTAVYNRQPITIQIDGIVSFEIAGVKKTLPLRMVSYEYSADLSQELGLSQPLENLKTKLTNLLGFPL
jgi:hypothetical protein